ncbi:hypothetical protein BDB01DRAFT_316071 [Pilobolus umbonatus]|nr:hypothetical protein BDB01DRAFT_316071 [Pilobolus umbonatus]
MKSLYLLCLLPLVSAQHAHGDMVDAPLPAFNATGEEPMSYALYSPNKGLFYLHVLFMVIAFWILMPIGIMLGIAKSSLHVPIQILSFCTAMVGFFFAKLYGHSTPHMYSGNSHHTLGWILFALLIVQVAVGIVRKIANAVGQSTDCGYQQVEHIHLMNSASMISSCQSNASLNEEGIEEESESPDFLPEEKPSITMNLYQRISPYIPKAIKNAFIAVAYNRFTKTICRYYHSVVGRTFVVLIFIQTLSGMVVYHGVCRSWEVLGCIAHLIKGGIFFFYGILTFGRYFGAFADRGWAWNNIEGGSSYSFEMIEVCLIFTYGITNTWMEHFGNDSSWNHKDFEHASLAFMWWWCGLIGILVESRSLRQLMRSRVMNLNNQVSDNGQDDSQSYSMNPFPAITVFMTGISMGNHHQETQYSSNIHFLWGLLLSCAAVCRFITYLTLYRMPPSTRLPSRPPSELVGAFFLIAGSILFMASNSGTMLWLRRNSVDSMFLMNVCVALTSMTLSYVAVLQLLKAWAERRELLKKRM